ncbi:MAG TPA: NUDIX domain-containing protein [Solirubrobacteraceae bacterium]|nr:NUDIX domain-containing protein [Solirubrobacteraceae bacterium]
MPISDYVRELRELVGHRQLLLPSVSALVWNEAGELLMVRNADTDLWQTVGGSIEPREHPREAAAREALEETGLEVELTGIRGVVGGPIFQHVYPNGDEVAFVSTVFDARPVGGALLAHGDGDETSAARFWAPVALEAQAMTGFTRELLTQMGVFAAPG